MSPTTASPSSLAGALERWKGRRQIERSSSRIGLWLLALGLLVFFEVHVGGFVTSSNLVQILQNVAPTLIAAIPAARLLITGNVDLSIAGGYAFLAVTLGQIMHHTPSPWLAVLIALALGGVLGLVNGLLVRWLKISPIIVTLALGTVYTAVAYLTTNGNPVYDLPASFPNWAQTTFVGVPMTVWTAVLVFGLGAFHLSRTVSGLHSYAIGGSALAARFSGVRVDRHVLVLYVYMGVSVALLAAVTTGAIGSASPTNGVGFEIDVLTAVILGGVAFNGGAGRWSGVFIGVVVIGILQAGFVFEGLNSYYQLLAKGALLLFALGADQVVAQRRGRARVPGAAAAVAAELVEETPVLDRAPVRPGLQATNLAKSYGAIAAVRDVSFNASRGEVTCLLGDNGAGKSTVIKMLSGVIQQDSGSITLEGEPVSFPEPAAAQQTGVHTVYQELALCTNLGAALNLVLGDEPRLKGFEWLDLLDRAESERRAKERMSALGVTLTDYFRPTGEMSGGQRQSVAISRVNVDDAKVVILDEPTAALGVKQTANVLRLARRLADKGAAVLMITHDTDSVMQVADHVVVLNLGQVIFDGAIADVSAGRLIHLMAGFTESSDDAEVTPLVPARST
jgi:ribose/xylose/arabinose/galactoside ABC-type transport system permease subunit/ABC-type branched-subunit amino acid transport system ATPase component